MAPRKNFDPNAQRPNDDESSLTRVARLTWDVGAINDQLDSINKKLDMIDARFSIFGTGFVTKEEFLIVRNIVYGMVGLILTTFMLGLTYVVFKGGK